jgi:ABC-type antimicrobial peptide transport system permease subunit
MDIGALVSSAWSKTSKNLGMAIGIYFVGIICFALSALTLYIAGPPIMAGIWKAMRKIQRGETPEFGDLFSEFSNFSQWFMLWVVMLVVGIVCGVLGIIPIIGWLADIAIGIVLGIIMAFVVPLMLERRMAAFDAIKVSLDKVKGNFGAIFPPLLVLWLIVAVSGCIPLLPLLTAPLMIVGVWEVYDHFFASA